jgi:hypothetical protein
LGSQLKLLQFCSKCSTWNPSLHKFWAHLSTGLSRFKLTRFCQQLHRLQVFKFVTKRCWNLKFQLIFVLVLECAPSFIWCELASSIWKISCRKVKMQQVEVETQNTVEPVQIEADMEWCQLLTTTDSAEVTVDRAWKENHDYAPASDSVDNSETIPDSGWGWFYWYKQASRWQPTVVVMILSLFLSSTQSESELNCSSQVNFIMMMLRSTNEICWQYLDKPTRQGFLRHSSVERTTLLQLARGCTSICAV